MSLSQRDAQHESKLSHQMSKTFLTLF